MAPALVSLVAALIVLAGAAASPMETSSKTHWWSHMAAPMAIPVTAPMSNVAVQSSTPVMIARYGYPAETYTIKTEDGYLLNMHRIPNPGKPAVYLQHGILSSSADYVVLGPKKALGFLLYNAGYDVWIGNFRGNTYSKAHVALSTSDRKFWDFSWHEIGLYDIPAMIDFILKTTGHKQLMYVAHSQGNTAFLVMASLRPEYNDKVKAFIAMAPVAFLGDTGSLPLKLISKAVNQFEFITKVLGIGEFLPSNAFLSSITSTMCANDNIFQPICTNILFLIAGYDPEELDTNKLPEIMQNTPAGSSTKQFLHFAQLINSGKFRQYDLGIIKNFIKYKSIHPPDYPLHQITTKVYLHYAENDLLATPKGVEKLNAGLTNVQLLRKVPHKTYNHLDFLWGRNSVPLLYEEVMASINEVTASDP